MGIFSTENPWVFAFGLLGNISSFVVFLAPVPTFLRVFKKKSTDGFQSLPYVAAIFSAMLWIYYASLKSDEILLITINSFGCVVETIYIALYIIYAPKQARMLTLRLVLLLNFGGFCVLLLLSQFLAKGPNRVRVLGWVSVAFSISVFAAPLSIMRVVIRTKSVEFMPFTLSFFLTLSAVMWLLYGIALKDFYVALPNILGFILGALQMVLYVIYKNHKGIEEGQNLPAEKEADTVKSSTTAMTSSSEVHATALCSSQLQLPNSDGNGTHNNQDAHEQTKNNAIGRMEGSSHGHFSADIV
ncbi:bidirectional sugar transporter SWEET12-like [Juglans microcarpa x Juglans regia]|uniref:bidirectional sugar transporter SWEET12-like n=1 Tax=Juglans microcarpa x Juglans regia TaxID=2249226 RepID=UPI001B7E2537|nr:bidirectional sugar transporter SWEET12-like [Juglans microcarpa x Juglans regia]